MKTWFLIHLARACFSPSRTHNQVFVNKFTLQILLPQTVATLNNGNLSLLQLVCGRFLNSSISPSWDWDKMTLRQRLTQLTKDVAFQANIAFANVRKTGRAEDCKIDTLLWRLVHEKDHQVSSYQEGEAQCRSGSLPWNAHDLKSCWLWSLS